MIELVSSLACLLVLCGPLLALDQTLSVTTIVNRIPAGSRGAS